MRVAQYELYNAGYSIQKLFQLHLLYIIVCMRVAKLLARNAKLVLMVQEASLVGYVALALDAMDTNNADDSNLQKLRASSGLIVQSSATVSSLDVYAYLNLI